jgi:hypothetical protein
LNQAADGARDHPEVPGLPLVGDRLVLAGQEPEHAGRGQLFPD